VKAAFVTGRGEELVVPARAVVHRSEVTGVYVVATDGRSRCATSGSAATTRTVPTASCRA